MKTYNTLTCICDDWFGLSINSDVARTRLLLVVDPPSRAKFGLPFKETRLLEQISDKLMHVRFDFHSKRLNYSVPRRGVYNSHRHRRLLDSLPVSSCCNTTLHRMSATYWFAIAWVEALFRHLLSRKNFTMTRPGPVLSEFRHNSTFMDLNNFKI